MSSTPRFFVAPDAIQGERVTLPSEAARHARTVLRLQVGEPILIHSDDGTARRCRLEALSAAAVIARVVEQYALDTEPRTRITVAQALPRNADKVEEVLRHGTEIGAAGFALFPAARSVARLEGDKRDKRRERWRGIVQSAAEQSGRGALPPVEWLPSLAALADALPGYEAALIAHESAAVPLARTLAALPARATRLVVIVGPEGGLTEAEVSTLTTRGGQTVSLGPRILRTETAALVALAQILYAQENPRSALSQR